MTASDIFEKEKTALSLHVTKIAKTSENVNSFETRHLSKSLGKINKKNQHLPDILSTHLTQQDVSLP